ncbi:ADRB2 [Branchiostoma lanceolatum]|uniref:ADRB2 protein n=1 Tax=Branchiostoma lanceolatum TaxID=7740 RepID=A0A8K0EEW6_BRALA|nr:ADRB2 [Branchiostoma lanceolatum]
MNVTEVFTEATDATLWFFGTAATPLPTDGFPSTAGCTRTDRTQCGIYGAVPSLQPLLIIVWLLILFWALFGNGCLLAAICTTLDMEERGNYFLGGMAVADILLALVHAPASIASLVSGRVTSDWWCKLQVLFSPGGFNLSVSFMTGLWYCRYRYIVYPFSYENTVTTTRIALAMVMSGVISFLPPAVHVLRHSISGAATPLNLANSAGLIIPCGVVGPERSVNLIIDIFLYGVSTFCIVRVLLEARKHRVQIANQVPALPEQTDAWKVSMKAVYTHLITVGVNGLTWLPILTIGGMLTSGVLTLENGGSVWLDVFWMINQTSTFSNSLVFAFRHEIYRQALRKLVRKISDLIDGE